MLRTLRDEHDERWARLMRDEFGRRRWLLSWQPHGAGETWIARLSCPQLPETIEREGRSRCHAIGRANRAMAVALQEASRDDCQGVGADRGRRRD